MLLLFYNLVEKQWTALSNRTIGNTMDDKASSGAIGGQGLPAVRLQEVALAAGVSTITVSRCISNPGRVSEKTREHVLKVAARMGYIPNRLASSLASAKSKVIAVVVPTIANPIHGMVLQGAADILEPAGYQLLLGNSHFSRQVELELVRTFLGHRVDGILLTGRDHHDDCLELIRRSRTPMVEMFDYNPAPLDQAVGSSNFDAGASIGQYLIAKGRKYLAYVGHTGLDDSRMMARFEGLSYVCVQNGMALPRHYEITSDPGTGTGGEVVGTVLREAPETDAIVFAGHQVAVGAIRYALDMDVEVPGRIAIAGFGDSPIAKWITPSLTTVRFPVRETGVEAGKLLLERLRGQESKQRSIRLGFEIMSRESA